MSAWTVPATLAAGVAAGVALLAVEAMQQTPPVDVWNVLVQANPLYAPALILWLLSRRVLVFGWYHQEQQTRAADDVRQERERHALEIAAERDTTRRERERADRWEHISWQWATTGKSAVEVARGAVENNRRATP